MAYILNLETATKNCSVSLSDNGKLIAVKEFAGEGYLHAEKLHVFIEDVLTQAGITLNELAAVAVSKGPGSYTGLRIGVSAAKGLCYALNVPLIALDTLEILARKISIAKGIILPLIDARRMEAYCAAYDKDYNVVEPVSAEIITEDSFSQLSGIIHLLGDGATKCRPVLNHDRFIYHDDVLYPSAIEMAGIAYSKYKISDTVDVAYFEPYYLKDFIAGK